MTNQANHQTPSSSRGTWSLPRNQGTSWALALLQVVGVLGLFAGVIGLCLFLAAGIAWLGQGHDGGFSRLGWPFLMSGLFLGGLGLLGDAWGHCQGQSRERALAVDSNQEGQPWPQQAIEGNRPHGPSRAA